MSYKIKLDRFKIRTEKLYADRRGKAGEIGLYADYQDLLKRSDVDAVVDRFSGSLACLDGYPCLLKQEKIFIWKSH